MIFQLLYRADDFLTDRVFQPLVVRFHVRHPSVIRVFCIGIILASVVGFMGWMIFIPITDEFLWALAFVAFGTMLMVLGLTWEEYRRAYGSERGPTDGGHDRSTVVFRFCLFLGLAASLGLSLFANPKAGSLLMTFVFFLFLVGDYFDDCRPFVPLDPAAVPTVPTVPAA